MKPGRLKRLCIHENTQGIARTALRVRPPARRTAGREPRRRRESYSIGVAARQYSRKPGVRSTRS